jgi:hypothetical protein
MRVPDDTKSMPQTDARYPVSVQTWHYGQCAEIAHRGPFSTELGTVRKLHRFIAEKGYAVAGSHEEEYLTTPDASRNQITVIRYPVRRIPEEKKTVVLVAPESTARTQLATRLIGDGFTVLLCGSVWDASGACPLLREERCALAERADAVAILDRGTDEIAEEALTECAAAADRVVVAPDTIAAPPGGIATKSAEASVVASALEEVLASPR